MTAVFTNKRLQLFIIVIVTFLAYSNIFSNDFVIDDASFIKDWPTIQSLEHIPQLLAGDLPPSHGGVYRPIRSVLYALYYQLFGTNPFGWHLHSLVVHLLSTVLVYLIVEQLFRRNLNQESFDNAQDRSGIRNLGKSHNSLFLIPNSIPFVSALLFGLHPIHTESIAYISASMDTTGILFLFASFYFYLKRRFIISTVFAVLAFFTFEMTLVLPFLILLYHLIFLSDKTERKAMIKKTVPYFVAAFIYIFVRMIGVDVALDRGDYLANSFYHTMITMPKIFVWYIWLLFVPFKLSVVHTVEEGFETYMIGYSKFSSILSNSILDPDILFSILLLVLLLLSAIMLRKKYPFVTFCIGWFFVSMLPVSYVVPVGPALSERYLYLSSFGFVLSLPYVILSVSEGSRFFVPRLTRPQNDIVKYVAIVLLLMLTSLYAYRTYTRNFDWRNSETLWFSVVREYPKSLIGHYNLSGYYSSTNNLERAAEEYQTIIALEPKFWEARFNLANTYGRQGRVSEAIEEYNNILATTPNFLDAYINLALAYDARGETDRAISTLTKGLTIDVSEYKVFNNPKSPQEAAIGFEKIRSLLEQLKNTKR